MMQGTLEIVVSEFLFETINSVGNQSILVFLWIEFFTFKNPQILT